MAEDKYENKNAGELRDILKEITGELSRQRTIQSESAAEYRKMDSIARQLQDTHMGISNLSSEDLKKLKEKNQSHIKELQYQAERLAKQKIGSKFDGEINNSLVERLKFLGKINIQEEAVLRAAADKYEIEKQLTAEVDRQYTRRINYEEDVKKLTGATGALLDGMQGSMNALGLGAAAQYLQIDKAKQAMQEEADAIARGEKEGGKLQVRLTGIKVVAEGLKNALFSVEAIVGFITNALLQGSKNMAAFQKQTGMSYESAYKLNTQMNAVAAGTGDAFITGEKLGKAYASLTEELGVSADILGNKALVSATNLEQRLGMSAEQSSKLTVFARLQGQDTEKILGNATATVGAFNNQNKTAINVKAVMDDVANASKATYLNMGKNVTALTQAATKAKSLGISLKDLENISESLLDFESSIGKELEAQLLTGGDINLAKAREYALTGDMKGLGEEIGKQEGILNAFRTNNVIAQKAAADALGITREQLADMTMQQELNTLGAENFKKQYGESAYESMKARDAAQSFGDSIEKIKSILGSIFQAFSPILDGVVKLLNLPFVPQLLAGVVAVRLLGGGLMNSVKSMGSLAKGALDFAKNIAGKGGAGGSIVGKLTQGAGGTAVESVGDKVAGVQDKTKGLNKGAGDSIASFFKGLTRGIKVLGAAVKTPAFWMGIAGIAALGAALIPLSYALGLAAPAIEAFGTVVTAAFGGLATLITAVADGFVKILGAVTMDNIGPMLLLGPALFGIAAGLSAVSLAGLLALPAIGGLVLLSKAAPALVSLGIGGENKSAGQAKGKEKQSALEDKLDALITELSKNQVINFRLNEKVFAEATINKTSKYTTSNS